MILLLCIICFIPLIFLPRVIFNAFSLPQIFALGTLSTLGMVLGVANGFISTATPSFFGLIFLIYMLMSLSWTQPVHNGVKEIGLQASLIFLFLISCSYINIENINSIVICVSIVSSLVALYSFGQTKGIDWFFPNDIKKGGKVTNAIGSIGNPNFLSGYLISSFWLSLYASFAIHPSLIILSIICVYGLFLTKSRAGLLGFIGSSLFCIITAGFLNFFKYGIIVANILSVFIALAVISGIFLLYKYWDIFWNSEIDPKAEQVWFATLRYRFCYWLSAWELIKEKPLFGWGMWSYRREVYKAQVKINEKDSNFLNPKRYLTPQPRECHNDFIEHIVEFGIVGFLIFCSIIFLVYQNGFHYLITAESKISFLLMLILLTNLSGILTNAFYFFPLRVPSSGINFWLTCGMIVGITNSDKIVHVETSPFLILICLLIGIGFVYNCIFKRIRASYYFSKHGKQTDPYKAMNYLTKTIESMPYDTLYRTYAATALMDAQPEMAVHHTNIMLTHYDGMCPLWATLFNAAYARLKDNNIYNLITFYLKNSLRVLPDGFEPTKELLGEPYNIGLRSRILDARRAIMRKVSEETSWKIKAMEIEKQNIQLRIENMQMRGVTLNAEEQKVLNEEKMKLNVPMDWVYDVDKGIFLSTEEQNKLIEQQNQTQMTEPINIKECK